MDFHSDKKGTFLTTVDISYKIVLMLRVKTQYAIIIASGLPKGCDPERWTG